MSTGSWLDIPQFYCIIATYCHRQFIMCFELCFVNFLSSEYEWAIECFAYGYDRGHWSKRHGISSLTFTWNGLSASL